MSKRLAYGLVGALIVLAGFGLWWTLQPRAPLDLATLQKNCTAGGGQWVSIGGSGLCARR